jgi:hypothetical protein
MASTQTDRASSTIALYQPMLISAATNDATDRLPMVFMIPSSSR